MISKRTSSLRLRRAFTLIELLVSVAMVSMLVGILLPSLTAGRRRAQRIVCQSNLRQIDQALWHYSVAEEGHVPWIETPMTNGGAGGKRGFGQSNAPDAEINPFDRVRWPVSMPNVLLADYLGDAAKLFVCPSALTGWPRSGSPYRFTYRDAGANQISGMPSPPGSYYRENFGFLDGRVLEPVPTKFTGDPIVDSQIYARSRSTYVRDLVIRENGSAVGPHEGGINVITRNFDIEWRDRKATNDDLASFGAGVLF